MVVTRSMNEEGTKTKNSHESTENETSAESSMQSSQVEDSPNREDTSQKTVKARSHRSTVSRKKLEELEIKERLAKLKIKQLQAEADMEIARLQRLRAEKDSEEEYSEEENEDSTWVDAWFDQQPREKEVPMPREEKQDEAAAERKFKQPQQTIDVSTLTTALLQASRRRPREPPAYIQELPMFRGLSYEWLSFKASYEDTQQYFSKIENVARLRKCIKGPALDAVSSLLLSQHEPNVIIEALERRFGRPEALILIEMDRIKSLSKITDNPRDLCVFAGKIANTVATIEALKKTQYLHSPEMTRLIIEKLTPIIKNKWYDYALKKEDIPELKKMSVFLNEEADKCAAYAAPERLVESETATRERARRKIEHSFATNMKQNNENVCPLCKRNHQLPDCEQFNNIDVNSRWETAKKNNICYKCLRSKHRRAVCRAPWCGKSGCHMKHHHLLHHDRKEEDQLQQPPEEHGVVTSTMEGNEECLRRRAYLKIVPVILQGPKSKIETYALLDEGSTVTLIDTSVADILGIDGPANTMWIQGVGAMVKHEHSKTTSVKIKGKHSSTIFKLDQVRTVDRLDITTQSVVDSDIKEYGHLKEIQEELVYHRASPKLLIGQDNWDLIVSREVRAGRRDQPVASYTLLGWVLHGCKTSLSNPVTFCGHLVEKKDDDNIEEMMKNYFKLESLCIEPRKPKNDPEQRALKILERESRRLPNGRYETGLLWREDSMKIPNNYTEARKRLHNLEKRLDRDEDLKIKYNERINNLLTSGYAEHAKTPPAEDRTWYLPHFPVANPAKPHKPPRLVHDASAKTAGLSLNDLLLSGPDLLQSLPGVVMRFRQYAYGVSADIKEMFMQVKIKKEDRDALRFLWRGDRREGDPDEYRMTSLIFGATSSPCTALYIKNRNAEDYAHIYPDAAIAIRRNHYMDDYLQSFSSISEARKITREVDYIHKQTGFVLSGWASNNRNTIDEFIASERDNTSESGTNSTAVLIGGSDTERALGLLWDINEDIIGFQVNKIKTPQDILENKRIPTKREALSIIMAFFDPLGLISPITTPAKRLLQDTWRYKTGWDESLPEELQPAWSTWLTSLRTVHKIRIPRCYDVTPVVTHHLHTFVDASEEAYAAAVYWLSQRADGTTHVTLAAAKSRVAPLKPVSIPRLELQAALMGARLAHTVAVEHDYEIASKTYWSDSRTVLAWIRSEPRAFKTFVAHRLAEIEDTTKKNEWRWVPTHENVADDATRGIPSEFGPQHRWFNGPSFLHQPENEWPRETRTAISVTGEERERCHVTVTSTAHAHLPDIDRFSRWLPLIKSTARVLQFVDLCRPQRNIVAATKKRTKKNEKGDVDWRKKNNEKIITRNGRTKITTPSIPVPAQYLLEAERMWMRACQEDSFGNEILRIKKGSPLNKQDRLTALSTYIDTTGMLRLRGRITATSNVEKDVLNPPVLDGKHRYTRLYIQHIHETMHHGGIEAVVNELRQRLWVVKIRPTVRNVVKGCLVCQIRRKKPASPPTGDLPAARLAHHARPFTYTGLDYFGPIETTVGRHREKRYGALFTCMTSRAIHIEVVHTLGTHSAIAALRRFMARRGCPTEIWSDNATCFKAAEKELKAAMAALEEEATNRSIAWRYIPPAAPFMGGYGNAWCDETLVTLLAEVENTVNSRPLTHVSVTPSDPEALTPNHILIGPNSHVPNPGVFNKGDMNARHHWRRAQALADEFWRRWVVEYLPLLQHRREPRGTGVPPKVGDIVIICDPNLPRNTWPRGRVVKTYPGKDNPNTVRVVDITTSNGRTLRRPTKRIVVLPVESQDSDGGRNVHDGIN
ncbi:uncharacterized protein LOC131854040 [Achroia grisella]|uniref:uncharacterized protein LOC131854040 n=1 Tax=Achroia grisella TaxID=688607 RepID=UPI0027D2A7C6|nr:uncharacterized protein LOC131854040 [Achroia grisella]